MERKAIFRHWRVSLGLMAVLFLLLGHKISAEASDLVISETMYDAEGADLGKEWVEIYNLGSASIMVSDAWRFFDNSYHKINLYQGTSTIAAEEFFILADKPEQFLVQYPNFSGNLFDTVINLSNSSSTLALSFDDGASNGLTDYYDAQQGGSGTGYSLEKIDLFANTASNWQESFVLGGTPGQTNSQKPIEDVPETEQAPVSETTIDWSTLLINEILPNPSGSDSNEWIELYNSGAAGIDITGLKIKDNSSRIFTMEADSELPLFLASHDYLLLPKSLTGLSLNNSGGETVVILDPVGNIIDQVYYDETALENRSYARDGQQFFWTKISTPESSNQISVNQAPVAQIKVEATEFIVGEKIVFSAEQSYDPEGEELDYLWQFPDDQTSVRQIIKHSFEQVGSYTVGLAVTDSEGLTDKAEFVVNIYQNDNQVEKLSNIQTVGNSNALEIDLAEDDLIISEFIPNPLGSDDGEWIELYNNSNRSIDLFAWQIDDQEGGSRPWEFSTSTIILAKDFLLLQRTETKVTLNNDQDSVRLLTSTGDVWQAVDYQKIPEGKSYAFDNLNKEWMITEPSPGATNIFAKEVTEEIIYSVSEISEQSEDQEVLVQGVAINNTDKNARSLYLADYDFSSVDYGELVEIYSYHKNLPSIKAGQLVSVRGDISRLGDLPRIKIKNQEDVWLNDLIIDLPSPIIIDVADLSDDFNGNYLGVRGTIVKKSGVNIYLAGEEDSDYQLRTINNDENLSLAKGDQVIAFGILMEVNDNFKLLPIDKNNIILTQQVQGEKIIGVDLADDVSASSSIKAVDNINRSGSVKNVLIFAAVLLIICWGVYFLKNKINL